jgi:hypothetical protein
VGLVCFYLFTLYCFVVLGGKLNIIKEYQKYASNTYFIGIGRYFLKEKNQKLNTLKATFV